MATTESRTKRDKIVVSDGRRGYQETWRNDDGSVALTGITITQQADGARCREVYGPRRYLDAHVYSFADLGNVTWEIES